ncbi:MAG: polyamine aminopropyltransferase [Spirochaetota bacterium]
MKINLNKNEQRILLFSVFVLSICGIIYELVLASLATYLFGNPVQQYSVTIGVFLSSMGLGSYLSRFIIKNLVKTFIIIEVTLGLIGGLSVIILNYLFSFSPSFYLLHLFFLIVIGTLVGLEIPLLTRILKKYGALKDILSNVLTLDYIGGLAGSLLFPLLLFPFLGRFLTSITVGLVNIIVSIIVIAKVNYPEKKISDYVFPVISAAVMALLIFNSHWLTAFIQNKMYYDDIVFSKRSKYQEIVLTRNGADLRLYLDGSLQFSTSDEYRYHEMLIFPGLFQREGSGKNVLVLGGGDGLAVRELLKSKSVASVTLVELDALMINLAMNNSTISYINGNSLAEPRVKVITGDAYDFLIKNRKPFDLIIADFPDPHDETIAKLYTDQFFKLVKRSLREDGVFVTQSTSPLSAREAFWCINKTMGKVFKHILPYHTYVPSFGSWGFNMASQVELTEEPVFTGKYKGEFRYFSVSVFKSALCFPADSGFIDTEVNTFNKPVLYRYYLKGWKNSDF